MERCVVAVGWLWWRHDCGDDRGGDVGGDEDVKMVVI
ncbi:hypothetical protein Tco_0197006, partial [Tanacetum coccineum]